MPPLRVCIDARMGAGVFGGVEQVVIGLAAALSKLTDGDEEYLFLTEPERDEWLRPYIKGPCRLLHPRGGHLRRRARAVSLGLLERVPPAGRRFSVRRSDGTVEAAGAEVMHFPFQDAFLTEIPSLYQPHDLQHLHLPALFSRWQHRRREAVYRAHCERATTVVMMTSWGKRDIVDRYGLPDHKVAVVPGASVLPEYPAPTQRDLDELRSRLALPEAFLLYPAQTWPHKNHLRLLEALALIRDRTGLAVPLVCPGRQSGDFRAIEARARALGLDGTTSFPGFVGQLEVRALYELARALVFPSVFEGWGLPICEAFSAGLPVAASTATSLPDLVGDAGLLFDPGDAAKMADAIERIWTDEGLRAELAQRGRERGSLFSFDRTARLFRAHYRQIAGHPASEGDRMLLSSPPLA